MKIAKLELFRYELPLLRSIQIGNIQIKYRSGMLIRIWDEQGYSGIGEIAPLPGLHRENLEEALKNLKEIASSLPGAEAPRQLEKLENGFENWIGRKTILPSVRFGLEMAVLNLLAEGSNQSLGRMLSQGCQETLEINGLVIGEKEEILDCAEKLIRNGYSAIKMKVGHAPIDEEIDTVRELREIVRGRAQARLDANRRWSFDDAVRFARSVGPADIEYIEEPLDDVSKLNDFVAQTEMPVALDESLHERGLDQSSNFQGLKAFVIKPSVIGGFERSMTFTRYAKAHGIHPVISSAFESGVTLTALANFAASLNPGNVAMGLDTFRWFEKDLLKTTLKTINGKLNVESVYRLSKNINYELLTNLTDD